MDTLLFTVLGEAVYGADGEQAVPDWLLNGVLPNSKLANSPLVSSLTASSSDMPPAIFSNNWRRPSAAFDGSIFSPEPLSIPVNVSPETAEPETAGANAAGAAEIPTADSQQAATLQLGNVQVMGKDLSGRNGDICPAGSGGVFRAWRTGWKIHHQIQGHWERISPACPLTRKPGCLPSAVRRM